MPHQCTNCGRAFDDGSKEMLSGCPDCGGNKFQFRPDGVDTPAEPPSESSDPPEPPDSPAPDSTVARTVGKTATTVRDLVGGSSSADDGPGSVVDAGPSDSGAAESTESVAAAEDTAQATARSEVVAVDELPASSRSDDSHQFRPVSGTGETDEPTPARDDDAGSDDGTEDGSPDRPDLAELREELNDQFESVKVVEPGQYELNLMELYDREEYIVALQEDGRYSIQVPETIRD